MGRLRFISLLLFLPSIHCILKYTDKKQFEKCDHGSKPSDDTRWLGTIVNKETDHSFDIVSFTHSHLITSKYAVITTDQDGRERMVSPSNLIVSSHSTSWIVTDVVIPASYNATTDETSLFNLAIVQVNVSSTMNLTSFTCLPHYSTRVNKTTTKSHSKDVNNWDLSITKSTECKAAGCEEILIANDSKSKIGSPWMYQNRYYWGVYGIGINETSALSTTYWIDFICKQTGICGAYDWLVQSPHMRSEYSYVQNGKYIENECTENSRLKRIKEFTPFTPLTKKEKIHLEKTCGRNSKNHTVYSPFDPTSIVRILSKRECGHGEMNCINEEKWCTGTMISLRHVITSADCIKSIDIKQGKMYVDYPNEYGDQYRMSVCVLKIHTERVSVKKTIFPPTELARGVHWLNLPESIIDNIALLELDENISRDSAYTNPICITHSSHKSPRFVTLQHLVRERDDIILHSEMNRIRYIDGYSYDHVLKEDDLFFSTTRPSVHGQYYSFNKSSNRRVDYGSPLIEKSGPVHILHGIVRTDASNDLKMIRISHYSTFICIHTGICEDGVDYTMRPLRPFRMNNIDMPPSFLSVELLNSWKSSRDVQWAEVIERNFELSKEWGRLYSKKLDSNEYKQSEEECGKHDECIVHIRSGSAKYQVIPKCHGTFISPRHVITTRDCILDLDMTTLHVWYKCGIVKAYTQGTSLVKHATYTGVEFNEHEYGIAILELEKNISPDISQYILCMPKIYGYSSRHIDIERPLVYLGLKTVYSPLTYDSVELDWTKEKWSGRKGLSEMNIPYEYYNGDYKFIKHLPEEKKIDHGSPLMGKRNSDGRYFLYGIVRGIEKDVVKYFTMRNSLVMMCKIAGVCPKEVIGDSNEVQTDFYVNGRRLCIPHNYDADKYRPIVDPLYELFLLTVNEL